jgi:hypothetical protein
MRPLSRRDLLLSTAALLGAPRCVLGPEPQGGGGPGPAKNLIVVFAEGGWDVTYCLDPKLSCAGQCSIQGPEWDEVQSEPDDREAVETFGSLPIVINDAKRPAVRSFFQRWHSRAHVVNGVWTGSIAHEPCRTRILTGTADGKRPDMATITGYTHGGQLPLGAIDLSGWSIVGPLASSTGRIGFQSQIAALIDPNARFRAPSSALSYPLFEMDPTDEASVETFVRRRAEQLRERHGDRGGRNDRAIDDLLASMDRGQRFRSQSAQILDSLRIGTETSFAQQLGIAVDLVEGGLCHTVTLDTREEWDTHQYNSGQHSAYERTFTGLDALMGELERRQMLDQVVVAVLSEMTRTPLRNLSGGKDHWGHTSALLLGAVRGDAVSGATDQLLESMPMDLASGAPDPNGSLCKYDNLCAGLLELVGVDPQEWLPGVVPFRGASV